MKIKMNSQLHDEYKSDGMKIKIRSQLLMSTNDMRVFSCCTLRRLLAAVSTHETGFTSMLPCDRFTYITTLRPCWSFSSFVKWGAGCVCARNGVLIGAI